MLISQYQLCEARVLFNIYLGFWHRGRWGKILLFTLTTVLSTVHQYSSPQWRSAHTYHDFTLRKYILLRYINDRLPNIFTILIDNVRASIWSTSTMASASAPVKPLTLPTVGKYTHLSNNEKRKIANRAYENEQQWIAEKESLAKVYDAKRNNFDF